MSTDKKTVNVAIAGMGRVGCTFLEKISSKGESGVKVIAVADLSKDAPGIKVASNLGIKVFEDTKSIVAMGDDVDLIFDLTGSSEARSTIRSELARSGNQHTVLAPEIVAFLMWNMMGEGEAFPDHHGDNKGY